MPEQHADHYAVLGLDPSASQRQISHAYRAMLRRHHPDTRGGSQDPMPDISSDAASGSASDAALQQVLAAYAVLRDPVRRAEYDRRRIPVRPRQRVAGSDQPPIQAGPVRWHPSRSGG